MVAGTAAAVLVIMVLSSIASIRRVFVLDPALVFRG
jgi:putative ABC transport system permease protein